MDPPLHSNWPDFAMLPPTRTRSPSQTTHGRSAGHEGSTSDRRRRRSPPTHFLSHFITRRTPKPVAETQGAHQLGDLRYKKRAGLEKTPAEGGRHLPHPGLEEPIEGGPKPHPFPPTPPILSPIKVNESEEDELQELQNSPEEEALRREGLWNDRHSLAKREPQRPWWARAQPSPIRKSSMESILNPFGLHQRHNDQLLPPGPGGLQSMTSSRARRRDAKEKGVKAALKLKKEVQGGRRKDLPAGIRKTFFDKKGKGKDKPSIKLAVHLVRNDKTRSRAIEDITKDFYANSSKASKAAKSKAVEKILWAACNSTYPLTSEKLLLLAGSLKKAGYKSGYMYLAEAKINHIEGGWAWTPQPDRQFKLCCTASKRGMGPRKKAPEVQEDVWSAHPLIPNPSSPSTKVELATHLFALGVHWMMREIEIAGLTTDDVNFNKDNRVVTMSWRVSKTDTAAEGTHRALQCICNSRTCDLKCPYAVLEVLCNKARMTYGEVKFLAVTKGGIPATKKELVDDWQALYGKEVTGHSTRRSGALQCIRRGWTISQTAFLGRWKSNIILEYAQEALQSLAVNVGGKFDFGNGGAPKTTDNDGAKVVVIKQSSVPTDQTELLHLIDNLKADVGKIRKDTKAYIHEIGSQVEDLKVKYKNNVKYLPDLVKSTRSGMVHINIKTLLCVQPYAWRTLCGWHYHTTGKYEFVEGTKESSTCLKCSGIAHGN